MKAVDLFKRVFCLALTVMIALFCSLTVFAVGEDDGGEISDLPNIDEYTEPYVEEPTEPEPEPVYTEPMYTEPEDTEPVYTDPEYTEPVITEAPTQENQNINDIDPVQSTTAEFVPPTLPKTVSTKKYTTNYTAGLISWVCVIVGIIVVAVAMISTKVSGRKSAVRR